MVASHGRKHDELRRHDGLLSAAVLLALILPGCTVWKQAEPLMQSPLGKKRQERGKRRCGV